ncbi:MAG: type I-B CRISPR-associated protein Cas8b/Csh1 [Lachnospiraceae bacterium]|nr:type I-B CRISPR-associated protein Cas8b/Csh1 [Lachnospiraceae bacterium]
MLKEYLEVFEKWIAKKGVKVITDAYIPKNGVYRLIQITDSGFEILSTLEISYDKKNDYVSGSEHMDYPFIVELDYYSKLLEMNKPIDSSKTIHANNYFSFAVRNENIQNIESKKEIIENYYQILKNPEKKYQDKKNAFPLYKSIEEEIGKPDIGLIEKIEKYVLEEKWHDEINLDKLDKKDYIKIFFVFPDREKTKRHYEKESRRYIIPNIYNNNDFNIFQGEEIFGLSNNNMNMNAKKPYLENKTRKISTPNLISQKQALLQNQMFDYFMAIVSRGKNCVYLINNDNEPEIRAYKNTEEPKYLQSGYYLRMKKEKNEVSIEQADIIVDYNPNLKKSFILKDWIGLSEKVSEKVKQNYENDICRLWQIKETLDAAFFEGKLRYSFDVEAKDLSFNNDDTIKQCFLLCREQLINWFWKGIDTYIYELLDLVTLRLIKNSIIKNKTFAAQHQFNIRWAVLNYLNEDRKAGESMGQIRNTLREHINMAGNIDWEFSSDDEFAYAVGQAVSYLLMLSKKKEKDESCINPFLVAKNAELIKDKLMHLYKKYNYNVIHNTESRFGKMAAAIMEHKPKEINSEMIMAGFVSSPLIYEKKNNKDENNENDNSEK